MAADLSCAVAHADSSLCGAGRVSGFQFLVVPLGLANFVEAVDMRCLPLPISYRNASQDARGLC